MAKHLPSPIYAGAGKHSKAESEFDIKNLITFGAGVVLLIAARLLRFEGWLRLAVYLVPYLVVAVGIAQRAAVRIQARRFLEAELLVLIATVAMLCIGEYTEAVIVLLLLRVFRAAEELLADELHKRAGTAFDLLPSYANVETEDGVKRMKPRTVIRGAVVCVAPGETVPLDGVVIEGISDIDASPVIGKARPKTAAPGTFVLSGCVNITNPLRISVKRDYSDSVISRILAVSDKASAEKSAQETLVYRFFIYCSVAACAAAAAMLVIGIFKHELITEYVKRAAVLLLAACPTALAGAVPAAYYTGISLAFKGGVLVKSSKNLEKLAKVRTFVTNKTGTLTEGVFRVVNVVPNGIDEQKLLDYAATAEGESRHPVAEAIRELGVRIEPGESGRIERQELPGRGVRAMINGNEVFVGNAELIADLEIEYKVSYKPGNVLYVVINDGYAGYIEVVDKVREGLFDALEAVRSTGVDNFVMLTGDTRATARAVASKLNFDMVRADLRKGAKLSALEYLLASRQGKATLCFVGDAFEDAEELRRADVGIGIGCYNENMELADCDAAMMGCGFEALASAFVCAEKVHLVSKLDILATAAIKALLLILGCAGVMGLWGAVAVETVYCCFMLGSTFSLVGNWETFKNLLKGRRR